MRAVWKAGPTVALKAEHWGGSTAVALAVHSDVQKAALRVGSKVGLTGDPWAEW